MQNIPFINFKKAYLGIILLLLITSVITFYCSIIFWSQDNPYARVRVKVPEGASLTSISGLLKDKQIISNPKSFTLAAKLLGQEKNIPAGVFTLLNASNNYGILRQLVNGSPNNKSITIIEGWTIAEVADEVSVALGLNGATFSSLCHDSAFIKSLAVPAVSSLEGFLFPETYIFLEGQNEKEIITRLVDQYKSHFTREMTGIEERIGLSELEIITMASIIEGEAIYDEERPIIAAVYYNRLKKHMRLQADPTIQYIIEGSPRRLLKRDLQIRSPYNTYRNYGLPIGPINSPGRQSILAALYPADVEYLYFVAKGDGYHTFSNTQAEHNQAKRKFQQVRRNAARERRMKMHNKTDAI